MLFISLASLPKIAPVVIDHAIRIVAILVAAYIASKIVNKSISTTRVRIIERMKKFGRADMEVEKRAATLSGILRKTVVIAIWVLAIVMALKEAGFDIGPLLAGAGVLGLALGFGAQYLVRDLFAGLFILLENQVRVNDVAIINGTGGLVEQINLRTIVLRSLDGTVHVFPNGTITTLSNMTHEFSYYLFNIGVAYKEDTDHVIEVLKQVADEFMQEEMYKPLILAPLEVLGVDQFGDSAVVIKARFKTVPVKQWVVGREMNRRIKKKFDEVGIEIPFPHRSIYWGEASKPFAIHSNQDREELKSLIREVLAEHAGQTSSKKDEDASPDSPKKDKGQDKDADKKNKKD
ncbi:MAG TPA: mechanosensitive ion channel family protein [Terriglobia bacterium]|nr:mechanosensitive ion channel family protein [Terriglobia bacterium]